MNRKNIDNMRFVDFDEFQEMRIVPIQFPEKIGENTVLKEGYEVIGYTKQGLKVEELFVERQAKDSTRCFKFIMDNWVNAKK